MDIMKVVGLRTWTLTYRSPHMGFRGVKRQRHCADAARAIDLLNKSYNNSFCSLLGCSLTLSGNRCPCHAYTSYRCSCDFYWTSCRTMQFQIYLRMLVFYLSILATAFLSVAALADDVLRLCTSLTTTQVSRSAYLRYHNNLYISRIYTQCIHYPQKRCILGSSLLLPFSKSRKEVTTLW